MIERTQKEVLANKLRENKLLIIQGPREVGKLSLVKSTLEDLGESFTQFDCSKKQVQNSLIDGFPNVESSFILLYDGQYLENLAELLDEVLTGKCNSTVAIVCSFIPKVNPELYEAMQHEGLVLTIYAPSFYENAKHFGLPEEERLLEERLIFGNYPDVLAELSSAASTLNWIIEDVIFTKLSANERINKGDKLLRVLQLLAFSIGDTVSFNDIGEQAGLDNETVERYVQLLEEAFILIHLHSYHTEQRYELKKSNVVYFVDNGIRNALIQNFNPPHLRNDMSKLWKNYVISERIKWIKLNQKAIHPCFWKTHTRQMVDYIEISGDQINAYKMDWEKRKKIKIPKYFKELYPQAKSSMINRSTYWTFLTKKFSQ